MGREIDAVKLTAGGSSSVTIHHHGAHVTSWISSTGREMIYTSPKAVYDGNKAIRGGIPICFPQFAKKGDLRQHGFARNKPWTPLQPKTAPDGVSSVTFRLESDEETLISAWPFKFVCDYTITLSADGDTLSLDFEVKNEDDKPFTFTTALHSYFTCDPENLDVPDLDGVAYMDSIDPDTPGPKTQQGPVTFGKEVDRIYISTPESISIPSILKIEKSNLPEAVVWNPYVDRSIAMADLPDDDWKYFICIEPARVEEPANVEPSAVWKGKVVLSAL